MLSIFKDLEKTNYKILLNNSRDPFKKYFTMFDIKSIIKSNVDYELTSEFYVKNMDAYVMNGEIVTLQPKAANTFNKDYTTLVKIALDFMGGDKHDKD